jgi:outer membrane protein assembly factor BamB
MHRLARPALVIAAAVILLLVFAPASEARKKGGGDLLWEDEFAIVEMSASGGLVAAIGVLPTGASVVRVYDADKGALLWEDLVPADSVVLYKRHVVVAGGGVVRAYDAQKGKADWHDTPPFAVTQLYTDGRTTIAAAILPGSEVRVRTYDTASGAVLVDGQTLPFTSGPSSPFTFNQGRAFVMSTVAVVPPGQAFPIIKCEFRAYLIATGEELWRTQKPIPDLIACFPVAVSTDGKRVFVAGFGGNPFGDDFTGQAYDADTGEFLWEHFSGIPTGFSNVALAVDSERKLAFFAGRILAPFAGFPREDFVIRALDVFTGALRWEARYAADCTSQNPCSLFAVLVAAEGGTVYGAGFKQSVPATAIPGTGFLRAYDSKTGKLRWHQDVDVDAIAATKKTVLVLTPSTEPDVVLRAYAE